MSKTKGWSFAETPTDQAVGQSEINKLEGSGRMEGGIDQRRRMEGGGHGDRRSSGRLGGGEL